MKLKELIINYDVSRNNDSRILNTTPSKRLWHLLNFVRDVRKIKAVEFFAYLYSVAEAYGVMQLAEMYSTSEGLIKLHNYAIDLENRILDSARRLEKLDEPVES